MLISVAPDSMLLVILSYSKDAWRGMQFLELWMGILSIQWGNDGFIVLIIGSESQYLSLVSLKKKTD